MEVFNYAGQAESDGIDEDTQRRIVHEPVTALPHHFCQDSEKLQRGSLWDRLVTQLEITHSGIVNF